jgi:DoxX-like family
VAWSPVRRAVREGWAQARLRPFHPLAFDSEVGVQQRLEQEADEDGVHEAGRVLAGLLWAPIGIAATVGVIAYFVLAIAAHIRAHDIENLPTPLVIELLAVTALVLRLE